MALYYSTFFLHFLILVCHPIFSLFSLNFLPQNFSVHFLLNPLSFFFLHFQLYFLVPLDLSIFFIYFSLLNHLFQLSRYIFSVHSLFLLLLSTLLFYPHFIRILTLFSPLSPSTLFTFSLYFHCPLFSHHFLLLFSSSMSLFSVSTFPFITRSIGNSDRQHLWCRQKSISKAYTDKK